MRARSFFAKRIKKVFASASTWGNYIKEYGWKRPARVYQQKPETGIRASSSNQIWHIDITMIRLVYGSKMFVQAVIDNFSRFVLAWKVMNSISGAGTKELLQQALKKAALLKNTSL